MISARTNGILSIGSVVLTAAYPLLVYFLMNHGDIRLAGLALAAILVLRFLAPGAMRLQVLLLIAAGGIFAAAIALTNSEILARLYPVGVSAGLLVAFGFTLLRPPPMIERLVRATGTDLEEGAVGYLRAVTVIWCAFFLVNGCIALATAVIGSREIWAIYNGLLSYLIAGTLIVGERLVRPIFRRRFAEHATRS